LAAATESLVSWCLTALMLSLAVMTTTPLASAVARWVLRRLAESAAEWAWDMLWSSVWSVLLSHGLVGTSSANGDDEGETVPFSLRDKPGTGNSQARTWGEVCTWVCLAIANMRRLRKGAV